jgi:O-antigen ligase
MDWMVDETGPNVNTPPASPSSGVPATPRIGWHGDRFARWTAIALGASLPISTALDNVLLVLIVLGWLVSAGYRAKWAAIRETWTSRVIIAIALVAALGLTYTQAPAGEALHFFVKHLTLLLVPVLLSLAWTQRERELAVRAFAIAMLVVLALSYGLAMGLVPPGPGPVIKGLPSNAYVFKLQITQSFLMAFAALLYAAYARAATQRAARAAWAVASLAAVVNIGVMVQGRTGYVVLLVLALVVLGHRYRWRGVVAAVLGGAVLVAGAYAGSSAFRTRVDQVATEWAEWRAGKARTPGGVYDRLGFYANTLPIIAAHPVIGVGTGGFAEAYRKEIAGTDKLVTQNPHSQFLLSAAEQGIPGLLLLLLLFYAVWRDSGRQAEPQDRLILRALLAATVVASLVNSTLIDHVETLFFAWGCGIALAGPRAKATKQER